MSVYIYSPDSDHFDSLILPKSLSYSKIFEGFDSEHPIKRWNAVRCPVYRVGQRGDFPSLSGFVPAFSGRALKALQPLLGEQIEALPLECDEDSFFAIHVLQVVNCLDEARSELERDPDGEVFHIGRYVFDEKCLHGKHLFRLRQAPMYKVFASTSFKKQVEAAGLCGLDFPRADD
jgi:hypothetical protein